MIVRGRVARIEEGRALITIPQPHRSMKIGDVFEISVPADVPMTVGQQVEIEVRPLWVRGAAV